MKKTINGVEYILEPFANLRDANLSGANLRGADLRGANLRGADLDAPILQMGPGGSRNDYTVYLSGINEVKCGCFTGTLEDFIDRVQATYKDGPHREWYDLVIHTFKAYDPTRKD